MATDFTYKKLQRIRELQLQEIKEQLPLGITIEVLCLVEKRVQTLIMAGLVFDDIKNEIKK